MVHKTQVKVSFPLFFIMFLIFMTLKLTGHISWSWWLVTAPLWGPWAGVLGILGICLIFGVIIVMVTN